MSDEATPGLTHATHPLVERALLYLRTSTTDSETFQRYARLAAQIVVLEALRDLPLRRVTIETPLETTQAYDVGLGVVFVPVLRSGLAMLDAIREFFPGAKVGFVGLERDETTAVAHRYYSKLPAAIGESRVIILDPMLATGGSAVATLDLLAEEGARDVRLACIVAAPDGVDAVTSHRLGVRVWTCALDRELNSRKFILPGLGDFGDRYYGTE